LYNSPVLNYKMRNKTNNNSRLEFQDKLLLTGAKAIILANVASAVVACQIEDFRKSYKRFRKSIAK